MKRITLLGETTTHVIGSMSGSVMRGPLQFRLMVSCDTARMRPARKEYSPARSCGFLPDGR